eukprot:TRINITY_DN2372_c0_g1_i2.p1 TRINITY_DN2372_c0_g1~~TRINITY_DN2372_c0_g1_i2.p1  ORF type:complete len:242 (-),score=1.53 TRINITY_DN2372_c0_g1_i2:85-810(-)
MTCKMADPVIGVVVYDDFTALGIYGPTAILGALGVLVPEVPKYRIVPIALHKGPYQSLEGVKTWVEHTFDDLPQLKPSIVLVPGGHGSAQHLPKNAAFIEALRIACDPVNVPIIAAVCTGSCLLAMTGRLRGISATTNKQAWDWVLTTTEGQGVLWQRHARWVNKLTRDAAGKVSGFITSSGVAAGVDMALALVEALHGRAIAEKTATATEHVYNRDPNKDPFAPTEEVFLPPMKRGKECE